MRRGSNPSAERTGRIPRRRASDSPWRATTPRAPHDDEHGVDGGRAREPFVGRARELAAVDAGIADAAAGGGRVFLVVGEPGIGKTRLLEEMARRATGAGFEVLRGRCREAEGAPPYWPWTQIVRAHVDAGTAEDAAAAAAAVAWLGDPAPEVPAAPSLLHPEHARFRLFDGLATFLGAVAARRPLLVTLDDLHAADRPSLSFLRFLAAAMASYRIVVAAALRDGAVDADGTLADTVGQLSREPLTECLELQGLAAADVARYIRVTTGIVPAATLVARLHADTDGNPFFVGESVRLLGTRVTGEDAARVRVPHTARAVIDSRLRGLTPGCRRLLSVAAVVGRDFHLSVVWRVAHASPERVLAWLEEAVRAHLAVEHPQPAGRYGFAHALIRQAVYEAVAFRRRTELHARVADALEEVHGPDDAIAAALAYHRTEAARGGGDVAAAIACTKRAAERAERQLAYEDAAAHYERALELLSFGTAADAGERVDLLLALGAAHRGAGNAPAARAAFKHVVDLARAAKDGGRLARAVLGLAGGSEAVVPGDVDAALVALLEETLRTPGCDTGLRAAVRARLAAELHYATDRRRVMTLSDDARRTAARLDDPRIRAFIFEGTHFARWSPENVGERLEDAAEIIRLADDIGDPALSFKGHIWRVVDLFELGDVAQTDAAITACEALAQLLKRPAYTWYPRAFRATRAVLDGRFEESERLAMEASTDARAADLPWADQIYASLLGSLRYHQGRTDEILPLWLAIRAQHGHFFARAGVTFLLASVGRLVEARRDLDRLAAHDFADFPHDATWLGSIGLLAETCAILGDARRARPLYDLLVPFRDRNLAVGNALGCLGSVSRFLGLLAARLGRWEAAWTHFEDALSLESSMGATAFVARTQADWARALAARGAPGDRERAAALAGEALPVARALGMRDVITATAALAPQEAPSVPDERPAPTGAALGAATFRREGEYWEIGGVGRVCRLRDAVGLHYLAVLLRAPERELLATDVLAAVRGGPAPVGDAGTILDPAARAAYRRRLTDLRDELDGAEARNDVGRAERARTEIAALADELARGVGLGGRDRRARSHLERARVNVTRAIKGAVRRIAARDADLGRYLETTVRTGLCCSYTPDRRFPIAWRF